MKRTLTLCFAFILVLGLVGCSGTTTFQKGSMSITLPSEFEEINRPDYTVCYNSAEDLFEFTFDYNRFPKGSTDYRGRWTVCTNGERIETVRAESANGNFVSRKIMLAEAWKQLFDDHNIHWQSGVDLKPALLAQTAADFYKRFMYLLRLTLQMRNSISNSEEDWLISPVRNRLGVFYDSRSCDTRQLPANADANGAYNIARKALWAIRVFKETEDEALMKASLAITNKQWLEFAQKDE